MKIPFPRVAYARLKRIIEAYYEIGKDLVRTAELHENMVRSIDKGDISGSAKFLVWINLLDPAKPNGSYKVTHTCKELGQAIKDSDAKKEARILTISSPIRQ